MKALMFDAVLLVALSLHLCASFLVNSGDSAPAAEDWVGTTQTGLEHPGVTPPAGWQFAFGPLDYEDWAGYATFKPVAALCKKPETFSDGNDLDARLIIIKAFVQNQDSSIVYACGTKDGGAIVSMFNQPWYNASKIHIHGSEASGAAAHWAGERARNHSEVSIKHIALSDVDSHLFDSIGRPHHFLSDHYTDHHTVIHDKWLGKKAADHMLMPSWGEDRTVSTKRMSTVFNEFMSDNEPGMQDHFDYVWINAEGTSETRAILGMGLSSGDPNGIIQGLAIRFPLIQFELGRNWLDFTAVDYSQDRQSGPVNINRPESLTTQQDMIRHLEAQGYAVFLMGKDQDLPLLIRIHEEFVHQATCVQHLGGKGFFLPGHALAVHWTIYNQDASAYQTHVPEQVSGAITAMVLRGQTYIQNLY